MMMKKTREREGKNNPPATAHSLKEIVLTAFIIIGVVALGLVAVNQFLEIKYKVVFLSAPCDLCTELNPKLETCFKEIINNKNINFFVINFSESYLPS